MSSKLYSTEESNGVVIVTLRTPNFDAVVASHLRGKITAWLENDTGVILDINSVRFADSAGLGSLCRLKKVAPQRFVVSNFDSSISEFLAKIPDSRLPIVEWDLEEAKQLLGANQATEDNENLLPMQGSGGGEEPSGPLCLSRAE